MWKITKIVDDSVADEEAKLPICSVDYDPEKDNLLVHQFRLRDDDNNPYYEGVSDDNKTEDLFAPLDDYGMPNAGCTDIQYKNEKGEWESC